MIIELVLGFGAGVAVTFLLMNKLGAATVAALKASVKADLTKVEAAVVAAEAKVKADVMAVVARVRASL